MADPNPGNQPIQAATVLTSVVAGAMANALGRTAKTKVADASGMSRNTVIKASAEVKAGFEPSDRQRLPGGGDKPAIEKQPVADIVADLAEVLDAPVAVVQADVLALACRVGAEGCWRASRATSSDPDTRARHRQAVCRKPSGSKGRMHRGAARSTAPLASTLRCPTLRA